MPDILSKEKKRKKNTRLRKFFFTLLIILTLAFISAKQYYISQTQPVAVNNISEVTIVIPKGSSTSKIALILKENNLIRNELLFKFLCKVDGIDGKLKAGKYKLDNGMTPKEILNKLVEGGVLKETVKFTIPEGFELREIADRLANQRIVNKEEFLSMCEDISYFSDEFNFLNELPNNTTLEGYLFPDTYEVYKDATEEEIIRKMLKRFDEVYNEDIIKKAKQLDMTINEVITLASIIEREAQVDSERPLISAVFHNRLNIGMKLQSCVTVQYALGERKQSLTYDDLEVESKYNTYLYKGLPPGPIASPGAASIEAAVKPADVDYIYFVANGDGTHTFTDNYKEFLKAKHDE
ncbi:endolytic transglycosylase MltG [Caldisalinibacter kiritimatiensis]|uniref:Endolytic murein transglycosylase n=1 Tax=Caldisalinibacter kiritimatiensis TaxID=1304284 RepID=R1CTV9_9FIRM|nr:endolytic transglycosylase MltG [Caldisalinibacter kiritimatiensis]EOD00124.1 Putative YceG protein [Caldisalinibacter kiritimatiensis]